jgi:hypothetical protein
MSIVIFLRVTEWDENIGYRCPALRIPGAEVTEIISDGTHKFRLPDDVDMLGERIIYRGVPRKQPREIVVRLSLNKKLVKLDTTVIVAIIAALATLGGAYISNHPDSRPAPPPEGARIEATDAQVIERANNSR